MASFDELEEYNKESDGNPYWRSEERYMKQQQPTTASANLRQVGGNHYRKMKIEHWDYVLANDIPYMEAQIIKYASRWRDKGGIQDLEKARHFLDKLIEWEGLQESQRTSDGNDAKDHNDA